MNLPFNGERLREARRFRQLSISQLAESIGVSKQMISKYERNDAQPSAKNYQKIVIFLGFPLKFFQQKDNFSYSDLGTFYRSRLSSTQSEKKPSELLKKYLAVLVNCFEEYVNFPVLKNYDLSDDPREAAVQLRDKWELKEHPINDMLNLLETHGFILASISSNSEKVDAFSSMITVNDKNYYCILIDHDNSSFYRQQFSLAHELGHWALHSQCLDPQELDAVEYREMEKEADIFASNFLLPSAAFSDDIIGNQKNLINYMALKTRWNVSIASMVYRAKDLDLLSSKDFVNLQKQISYKKWRVKEPYDDLTPVSVPQAMSQAFHLLLDSGIIQDNSISRVLDQDYNINLPSNILSELIGVPVEELFTRSKDNIINIKESN